MIAFKDNNDGYYQFDWDGVSELPEWTKGMTAVEVVAMPVVPPTYQELRAAAYPSIVDQLDLIYHGGLDAWKMAITAVKEEFPK
tara:strand:+ start:483 stop:734 length:252 start_codon:yes stop_codon:yes gene_type:complete